MLPDVNRQQRDEVGAQWRLGIAGRLDSNLVVIEHEPDPAATELSQSGIAKLVPEAVEVAILILDHVFQLALRRAAAVRTHALPQEPVVPGLGRVVEDGGVSVRAGFVDDLLERQVVVVGAFNQAVQLLDVTAVMLVVVIRHCLAGNVGFQRPALVREKRLHDCHCRPP